MLMTSTHFTTSTYLLLAKSFIHSFNHLTKASIYIHIITSILIFTWLPTSCFVVRSGNFYVRREQCLCYVSLIHTIFIFFPVIFIFNLVLHLSFSVLCFIFLLSFVFLLSSFLRLFILTLFS